MNIDRLDLAILKTITTNRKYAIEFINNCSEKLFLPDAWRFSKIITEYLRIYKNVPTKRIIIEKVKQANNEALLAYVEKIYTALDNFEYDDKEYSHDLEKIKQRYSEKLISGLKDSLVDEHGMIDVKGSYSKIQTTLNNIKSINQPKAFKEGTIKEYAEDFKNIYQAKLKDPTFGVGIKTGYSFIDYATSGLRPGELLIYAGTTGAGKSIMLANSGINMWLGENTIDRTSDFKPGQNILLFSLEMNYDDYQCRLLSRLAMVQQRNLRDAKLTDEEKVNVNRALKFINNYPYRFKVIDTPKLTSEGLEIAINNEIAIGHRPDIVIIDYLNIMKSNANKDNQDWLIQAALSEEVHQIARSFEMIVLSAVQLNPKGDKDGAGEFGIKNLRRSTAIADNVDFLAIIQNRRGEKNYPDLIVEMAKNRRGELTNGRLNKQLACCAILDNLKNNDNGNSSDIEDISDNFS